MTTNNLPFVTDEDRIELASEAIIGAGIYRERLWDREVELARDPDVYMTNMSDVDRWTRQDARALLFNTQYRSYTRPGALGLMAYDFYAMPRPEPRIKVASAEAMLSWPIYRAALNPVELSIEDRQDLLQALDSAGEALSMKREIDGPHYEPEDLAAMDEALERWSALSTRLGGNGGAL